MLKLYIISVILCFILGILSEVRIRIYLKTIGRKVRKYEWRYWLPEKIKFFIKNIIPVYNLFLIISYIVILVAFDSIIYNDKLYNEMIKETEEI